MDATGDVALFALLEGPGIVGGEQPDANSITLWRESGGVLSLVVQQGDPIPGAPGKTFTGFPDADFPGFALAETPDLQDGRVAFRATGGLYVETADGLAAVDLDSPPVGLPAGSTFLSLIAFSPPHVEPDGSVLLRANYDVPNVPQPATCLVRGRPDAPPRVVLAEGLPVPDAGLPADAIVAVADPSVSFPGGMGFPFAEETTDAFAVVVRLTGPGLDSSNDDALLVHADDAFTLLAREGAAAPGAGATWGFFSSSAIFGLSVPPTLNASGQIAFGGEITGGVAGGAAGLGVFTDRSGALDKVLLADEICTANPPFGDPVPSLRDFVFSSLAGGTLNDAGHLAVLTDVIDSTISPLQACFSKRRVLLSDVGGTLEVVLEEDAPLPGGPAGVGVSAFLGQPRMTRGDIVLAQLVVAGTGIGPSNDEWILAVGPDGVVEPLLREGDLVEAGGETRAVADVELGRGVSTTAELPVTLTFTDGTAGVFALRAAATSLGVVPAEIPATAGGTVAFDLAGGEALATRAYALLGSVSGTVPGVTFPSGAALPLNLDAFTSLLLANANGPALPGVLGAFDALGNADAALVAPGPLDPVVVGVVMDFAWIALSPIDAASDPVAVTFVP